MAVVGGSNVVLNPIVSIGRLVGSPRLMHPVELMGILSPEVGIVSCHRLRTVLLSLT